MKNLAVRPAKSCTKCGNDFCEIDYKVRGNGTGKIYWHSRCHKCRSESNSSYSRKWRLENPDKSRNIYESWRRLNPEKRKQSQLRSDLHKKYGITPEYKQGLLEIQNFTCSICPEQITLSTGHVDHNHKTGSIRGLLCKHCNLGIGHFQDNPEWLRSAARYIEESK